MSQPNPLPPPVGGSTAGRKCRRCSVREQLAAPFTDGLCDRCCLASSQEIAIPTIQSSGVPGRTLVVVSGVLGITGYIMVAFAIEAFHDRSLPNDQRTVFAVLWFVGLVILV